MKRSTYIAAVVLGLVAALPATGYTRGDNPHSAAQAARDAMITTKIKAAMAKDKGVSATHIKVETDDGGVVQLGGTARSREEAGKAVAIARSIDGVRSVKNHIHVASSSDDRHATR
jgi:hyperosmotically inducible periplasmic protein